MRLRSAVRPLLPIAAAAVLAVTLSACGGSGLALTQNKSRGYSISEDAVKQIRVGQSEPLVVAVLGSPQVTNSFETETAWYYMGEKVSQTAFGLELSKERTLLAIYFDKKGKVKDLERLSVQDGKVFTIESRKTPSYGADRTFVESIIASF